MEQDPGRGRGTCQDRCVGRQQPAVLPGGLFRNGGNKVRINGGKYFMSRTSIESTNSTWISISVIRFFYSGFFLSFSPRFGGENMDSFNSFVSLACQVYSGESQSLFTHIVVIAIVD